MARRPLMTRLAVAAALTCTGLLSQGCLLQQTVQRVEMTSPNPDQGRPGWIQGIASGGAWLGGVVGGVVSVVLLPVTLPIDYLASEDGEDPALSRTRLWFPMEGLAAAGSAGLAWPFDSVDYISWRIWLDPSEVPDDEGDPEPIRSWSGPVREPVAAEGAK